METDTCQEDSDAADEQEDAEAIGKSTSASLSTSDQQEGKSSPAYQVLPRAQYFRPFDSSDMLCPIKKPDRVFKQLEDALSPELPYSARDQIKRTLNVLQLVHGREWVEDAALSPEAVALQERGEGLLSKIHLFRRHGINVACALAAVHRVPRVLCESNEALSSRLQFLNSQRLPRRIQKKLVSGSLFVIADLETNIKPKFEFYKNEMGRDVSDRLLVYNTGAFDLHMDSLCSVVKCLKGILGDVHFAETLKKNPKVLLFKPACLQLLTSYLQGCFSFKVEWFQLLTTWQPKKTQSPLSAVLKALHQIIGEEQTRSLLSKDLQYINVSPDVVLHLYWNVSRMVSQEEAQGFFKADPKLLRLEWKSCQHMLGRIRGLQAYSDVDILRFRFLTTKRIVLAVKDGCTDQQLLRHLRRNAPLGWDMH